MEAATTRGTIVKGHSTRRVEKYCLKLLKAGKGRGLTRWLTSAALQGAKWRARSFSTARSVARIYPLASRQGPFIQASDNVSQTCGLVGPGHNWKITVMELERQVSG